MKDKLLKEPPAMIEWHRLFGLTLKDFFSDTGYEVELEKDLSVKQQFLDVVIIEKEDGKLPEELPGASHYRWKTKTSTVMNDLFRKYDTEGVIMPYTFEDYKRDYVRRYLHSLTPEKLLEDLSADEELRDILEDRFFRMTPTDKIIKRIPKEEMLKAIMADGIFESIPADEVLKHIPKHEVEKYLTKLNSEKS